MERADTEPLMDSQDYDACLNANFDKFTSVDIRGVVDQCGTDFLNEFDCVVQEPISIPKMHQTYEFPLETYDATLPEDIFASDPITEEEQKVFQIISNPIPSLSFETFPGDQDFQINVNAAKFPSSKWCYSNCLNKLFVMPNIPVPVEVSLSSWEDAVINITPVFIGQHYNEPVNRCHLHRKTDQENSLVEADHVIQVDGKNISYKQLGDRYCAEVAIGAPAPGEHNVVVYVKAGCWNTCVGGPSRRPFRLVFTLFVRGTEVGRQVLNMKSCQCPMRDIATEEKKLNKPGKMTPGSSLRKTCPMAKGTKRIKLEAQEQKYENISVPSDMVKEVKRLINSLTAEKHCRNNVNFEFPYTNV